MAALARFECWMGTQAAQSWLLFANLVAVGIYVWFTRGIREASNKQSEGLSKPVVTVRCSVPTPDDMVIFSGLTSARIPGADLELVNIGNGPAIHLHCKLVHERPTPGPASHHEVKVPYLERTRPSPFPAADCLGRRSQLLNRVFLRQSEWLGPCLEDRDGWGCCY